MEYNLAERCQNAVKYSLGDMGLEEKVKICKIVENNVIGEDALTFPNSTSLFTVEALTDLVLYPIWISDFLNYFPPVNVDQAKSDYKLRLESRINIYSQKALDRVKKKYETYVKASGTMNIEDLMSYMKQPVLRSVLNQQIKTIEAKEERESQFQKVAHSSLESQKVFEHVWDTKVHLTGRYCQDYGEGLSWKK